MSLLQELQRIRDEVKFEGGKRIAAWEPKVERESFLLGARNLAYYLALRRHDRREVQQALLERGLSSLGRCESRVLPNLQAVIAALAAIEGDSCKEPFPDKEKFLEGVQALESNTVELFGPPSDSRRVRIMVTLPTEAAQNPKFIHDLLLRGMDCARINCAHDSPAVWKKMVAHVRAEADRLGKPCRIAMDLSGPKARLGKVFMPDQEERIRQGAHITLVRPGAAAPGGFSAECLLEEAIDQLKVGVAVWIDDGKLGCRVVDRTKDEVMLEVTHASQKGFRLRADKGLNFPGSQLNVDPLTDADRDALDFIVKYADIVAYSFVQSAQDVEALLNELDRRQDKRLGIIAKIETERAVHQLPEIIVAAAGKRPLAVMIARGDLAVEIGWERISEMQEEILWICEAAHVPVIWATQVLETLVKKGSPSRAEVTDAAMSERAECVMLNKGPYIGEGLALLVNVLCRMQEHQWKKMPRLRALRCWRD